MCLDLHRQTNGVLINHQPLCEVKPSLTRGNNSPMTINGNWLCLSGTMAQSTYSHLDNVRLTFCLRLSSAVMTFGVKTPSLAV